MKRELKVLSDNICKELLHNGFKVQRYFAYSTNSIYIKVDYGVCNSIRISDHMGKKHLKYRFNVIVDYNGRYLREDRGFNRYYYRPNQIQLLLKDITELKQYKMNKYRSYKELLNRVKIEDKNKPGFWQTAKEVYLDNTGELITR